MRALFLIAALAAATPAIAASPTPPTPPIAPSPPALALENAQKAIPPLRLRSPLMLDDRRRMVPPGRFDQPTGKPNPKNGGGPEIG
jgi:hypothetical protein